MVVLEEEVKKYYDKFTQKYKNVDYSEFAKVFRRIYGFYYIMLNFSHEEVMEDAFNLMNSWASNELSCIIKDLSEEKLWCENVGNKNAGNRQV